MTDEEYAECVDSLVDRMKSTKYYSQSQSTNPYYKSQIKDDVIEDNESLGRY
tara:strand:+ start:1154 stop:1309 length:156 start_codon:yes stop_codon:yes gene_type:complete